MSFHLSAEDIRIDDKHTLQAKLRDQEGELQDAEIDLDQCLGNSDGMIHWGGRDFSQSAEDVSFSIEGDDQVPVLRVSLVSNDGERFEREVNLAERLGNDNGQFVYV